MAIPLDDVTAYCACMESIKRRLDCLDSLTSGVLTTRDEEINGELACLQLRKVLELVAFASLAASRQPYADVHDDGASVWRATRIIERLKAIHPHFYPVPLQQQSATAEGMLHFEPLQSGFLTLDDFEFLYDKCSDAIHAWNPYRPGPRVVDLRLPVAQWIERIHSLLWHHQVHLFGQPDIILVQMDAPEDHKVHAYPASPREQPN